MISFDRIGLEIQLHGRSQRQVLRLPALIGYVLHALKHTRVKQKLIEGMIDFMIMCTGHHCKSS